MRPTEAATLDPPSLLDQFLAWVAARPRTYGDTMDAWRTSCPRLSDGLVAVVPCDGPQRACAVTLTELGHARLGARM